MRKKTIQEIYCTIAVLIVLVLLLLLTDIDKIVLDMIGAVFQALFALGDMIVK
jgi:hypothetical protein